MRRALRSCLVLAAALAVALPAGAQVPVTPGFTSPGIEFVTNIPIHLDGAGGYLDRERELFYVTDSRLFSIYSYADPASPELVGTLVRPQVVYAPEEDLDSNGDIAIVGAAVGAVAGVGGAMYVIDVRDPASPTVIGELAGTDEHTMTCALDCTWVYGSSGAIVDLTDPTSPVRTATDWDAVSEDVSSAHDITEVAPGILLTSSNPMLLLDVREDPAHPTLLRTIVQPDDRFVHGNLWPRGGTDRFVLVGGEEGGICDVEEGPAFTVFEAGGATEPGIADTFTHRSDLRIGPSTTYEDGRAPYNTFCAHWFTTHPTYADGGLVAMSWYEDGTRFFHVKDDGSVEEVAHYVPAGTSASAAYWIDEEYVWIVDYQRGLDVIRFTADVPPPGRQPAAPTTPGPAPEPAPEPAPSALPTTGGGLVLAGLATVAAAVAARRGRRRRDHLGRGA